MSKGDRFCNSCFAQRENNASRTYHEHYDLAYWDFTQYQFQDHLQHLENILNIQAVLDIMYI